MAFQVDITEPALVDAEDYVCFIVSFRQGCVRPFDSKFLLGQEAADGGSADLKLAGDFGFADSLPM